MDDCKKNRLKGKRLAALDYGRKRVGFAVCDELHISISPRKVYDITSDNFWQELIDDISKENVAAIIVGVPYRHDNQTTELIEEIEKWIIELKEKTKLDIYKYDEAFSTHRAVDTMLKIGKKKKKRAKKGSKDMIAAAIILRDFLNEMER